MNLSTAAFLLLMISLSALVGCGSGAHETKLEISKSFIENPNFPGGLIIYGESSTGENFTVALDSQVSTTVSLLKGNWTFYATGWDGNANNKKFEGAKRCGYTTAAISATSTVSLSVTNDGCANAKYLDAMKLVSIAPTTCGAFYNYVSSTNLYTPISASSVTYFCNELPINHQSDFTHYRLVAIGNLNGNLSIGFESECKQLSTASVFNVPTSKIPMGIRIFKSSTDCAATTGVTTHFKFIDGIAAGNPSNFGHKFFPSSGLLALPSAISRQGVSPFMNMIPSITCGGINTQVDCFGKPAIASPEVKVNVPWIFSSGENQVVRLKTTATTCNPSGLVNGGYFSASSCHISDGKVYAQVNRNQLLCQPISSLSGILDMELGKISGKKYLLVDNGIAKVTIYDNKGVLIKTLESAPSGITSIAITPAESRLYATNGGTIYELSLIDGSPLQTLTGLTGVTSLAANNLHVFYNDGMYIKSLDAAGIAGGSISNIAMPTAISKIQIDGVNLYALNSSSLYQSQVISNGTFTAYTQVPVSFSGATFFHVGPANIYIGGSSVVYIYDKTNGGIALNSFSPTNAPTGILFDNNKIYLSSFTDLVVKDNSGANDIHIAGSMCEEDVPVTIGGTTETIHMKTFPYKSFDVFRDAIRILGRRDFEKTESMKFLFEPLSRDEDDGYGSGGVLSDVQKDLSAGGFSGLIGKDYPTCQALLDKVVVSPLIIEKAVYKPSTLELFNVTLTVSHSTRPIPNFFCISNDAAGAGCSSAYDFDIRFSTDSLKDATLVHLKCDRRLGSFETREHDGDSEHLSLKLWNTEDSSSARVESYYLSEEGSEIEASMTRIKKVNDNEIVARELNFSSYASSVSAAVTELNVSASNIMTKMDSLSENSATNLFENTSFVSSTFLSGSTDNCMTKTNTNMYATSSSCNLLGTSVGANSTPLQLNVQSFENISIMRSIFDPGL